MDTYDEERAKRLLSSWGAWKVPDASIRSSAEILDDEVLAEGHDHCLLTDFDSLMIQVDTAVDNLNPAERELIIARYGCTVDCPRTWWCMKYELTERTYRRTHKTSLLRVWNSIE